MEEAGIKVIDPSEEREAYIASLERQIDEAIVWRDSIVAALRAYAAAIPLAMQNRRQRRWLCSKRDNVPWTRQTRSSWPLGSLASRRDKRIYMV